MKRRQDWAARLADFIDGAKREAFAWGDGDCVMGWAARAVEAQTGVDPAAEFRGRYATVAGARRALKKTGAADLLECVAAFLPAYDHPSQAQMGDIAAIRTDGPFGFTLGIVNGETILVRGENGMHVAPRHMAVRAYRVG